MKLRQFTKTYERTQRPMLRFARKSGLVTINKAAVEKIGLNAENHFVQFFQDEDSPKDWYISLGSETGFKVRQDKKDCNAAFMNNSALVKELVTTLSIPEDCNSFIIGGHTEMGGGNFMAASA